MTLGFFPMGFLEHTFLFVGAYFLFRHYRYQASVRSSNAAAASEDTCVNNVLSREAREARGGVRTYLVPTPSSFQYITKDARLMRLLKEDLSFLRAVSEEYLQIPEWVELFLRTYSRRMTPRAHKGRKGLRFVDPSRDMQIYQTLVDLKDGVLRKMDALAVHVLPKDQKRLAAGREALLAFFYEKLASFKESVPILTVSPELDAPSAWDPRGQMVG